ncbi:restriction endonuclease, partial [Komagataeibacter rhaeticus]
MSALSQLLDTYRNLSVTEREKGTYFEELIVCYLRTEPSYADLYDQVWTYKDWATQEGYVAKDTGIDLVARTRGTGEYHAIQCKFYAPSHRISKQDIDSFFTASGKKHFARRIIVATTNHWTDNAEASLANQHPPVSKIDLYDLCGRPVRCNGSHLLSLCVSLNLVFSVECIAARRMRGSGQVRP